MSSFKKRLLLIDGNSLFHRAYHALPPLTSKSGEMANAVFGFSNMLIKALNQVGPDYVACAFDTEAPTFRHVEFEAYKAQRLAPPPDLYPQLPKVKEVLDAFGIKYFEKDGYEADDLLAAIVSKVTGPVSTFPPASARSRLKSSVGQQDNVELRAVGSPSSRATPHKTINNKPSTINVIILSGDRDVLQLVSDRVKVQAPGWNLKETTLYGAEEIREKYGLEPHQMVDYKALTGDASDNVPGVNGIGPKTAGSLLQKYHTLENLYKHIKDLPESIRSKLEAGQEIAFAAKKLVELDRNVDIEFELGKLEFKPDWQKVRHEYEALGFKSIVAKLPTDNSTSEVGSDSSEVNSIEKKSRDREHKANNNNQLELI